MTVPCTVYNESVQPTKVHIAWLGLQADVPVTWRFWELQIDLRKAETAKTSWAQSATHKQVWYQAEQSHHWQLHKSGRFGRPAKIVEVKFSWQNNWSLSSDMSSRHLPVPQPYSSKASASPWEFSVGAVMRSRVYGVGDERCRSQHRVPNGGEAPGRGDTAVIRSSCLISWRRAARS